MEINDVAEILADNLLEVANCESDYDYEWKYVPL